MHRHLDHRRLGIGTNAKNNVMECGPKNKVATIQPPPPYQHSQFQFAVICGFEIPHH